MNISGPSIIGYFSNRKLNKKIIVMGEYHGGTEGECSDEKGISITDYLSNLFTSKFDIDFFIETNITDAFNKIKTSGNIIDTPDHYIDQLRLLSYKTYKKRENIRIHFVDIRADTEAIELAFNEYKQRYDLIDLFNNIESLTEEQNLFDIFSKSVLNYTTYLYANLIFLHRNKIDSKMKKYISTFFLKEYSKLKENNKDTFGILREILETKLRNYLDYFIKKEKVITLDNLNLLDDIYRKGQIASAAITDFYTIARILNHPNFKHNIIYVGRAHYFIIKEYLKSLDFELVEKVSYQNNHRCIENIEDFESFFTQRSQIGGSIKKRIKEKLSFGRERVVIDGYIGERKGRIVRIKPIKL